MVIIRKYRIYQPGIGTGVEVARHVIRAEGELRAALKLDIERMVVFRVDCHTSCDTVVKQTGIQVTVTVINDDEVGVLVDLLKHVVIIHQFRISSGQDYSTKKLFQGSQEKGLARTPIALPSSPILLSMAYTAHAREGDL